MCPISNGDGLELEKSKNNKNNSNNSNNKNNKNNKNNNNNNFNNNNIQPPPSISVTSPADVIDAGLKSLDHCEYSDYGIIPARAIRILLYLLILLSRHSLRNSIHSIFYQIAYIWTNLLLHFLRSRLKGSSINSHCNCSNETVLMMTPQTSANFHHGDTICDRLYCL